MNITPPPPTVKEKARVAERWENESTTPNFFHPPCKSALSATLEKAIITFYIFWYLLVGTKSTTFALFYIKSVQML